MVTRDVAHFIQKVFSKERAGRNVVEGTPHLGGPGATGREGSAANAGLLLGMGSYVVAAQSARGNAS